MKILGRIDLFEQFVVFRKMNLVPWIWNHVVPEIRDVQNVPSGTVGGSATGKQFMKDFQREVMVPVG